MKKYKLERKNKILSMLAASSLTMNMWFIPPFLPKEKFTIKQEETQIEKKRRNLLQQKYVLKQMKFNNKQNSSLETKCR